MGDSFHIDVCKKRAAWWALCLLTTNTLPSNKWVSGRGLLCSIHVLCFLCSIRPSPDLPLPFVHTVPDSRTGQVSLPIPHSHHWLIYKYFFLLIIYLFCKLSFFTYNENIEPLEGKHLYTTWHNFQNIAHWLEVLVAVNMQTPNTVPSFMSSGQIWFWTGQDRNGWFRFSRSVVSRQPLWNDLKKKGGKKLLDHELNQNERGGQDKDFADSQQKVKHCSFEINDWKATKPLTLFIAAEDSLSFIVLFKIIPSITR